jgi:hypothetical protein
MTIMNAFDLSWTINKLEIKYRGDLAKYKIYEDLSNLKRVPTPGEQNVAAIKKS